MELDLLQDRNRPGNLHLAELAAEEEYAEHRQREADEAALDGAAAAEQPQQPSASQAVPPAHGAAGAAHSGTVPDAVDEVSWRCCERTAPTKYTLSPNGPGLWPAEQWRCGRVRWHQ